MGGPLIAAGDAHTGCPGDHLRLHKWSWGTTCEKGPVNLSAILGTGLKFVPLPSAHAHDTNVAQVGYVYCLCIDNISMVCEHVLLIDDHVYYSRIIP